MAEVGLEEGIPSGEPQHPEACQNPNEGDTGQLVNIQVENEDKPVTEAPVQPASLQVNALTDSENLTDSFRDGDETTTEADLDTEIEMDPDNQLETHAIASPSGLGANSDMAKDGCPIQKDNTTAECLPHDCNNKQGDIVSDLDKSVLISNTGMIPHSKDVIVVTAEDKMYKKFLWKREIVFCMIGGVSFLIGLIMIIVGLLIMQGKCDKTYWSPEAGTKLDSRPLFRATSGAHDHVHGHGHSSGELESDDHHVVYVHDHHHDMEDIDVSFEDSKLNLAEGRPAFQSSTVYHDDIIHNASLATDGSTSLLEGRCSQTELEEKPYWFVDLGREQRVKRLKIIAQAGQLHDFEVRIGSEEENLQLNHLCKEYLGTALKVSINLMCDQYSIGRYVSIQMLGDESRPRDTLALCEVLVYAS